MEINQHALKFIFNETLFRIENSVVQAIETDINFLGKNEKNILIITKSHKEILEDNSKVFLSKILNSVGLQLSLIHI